MTEADTGPDKPGKEQAKPETDIHVPETAETEPEGHSDSYDYSSAEELAEEGLPEGEESLDTEALLTEIADLKDKLLRAVAEAENARRRAEKEKADATKFGITRFARDLMSVADNFQRALDSVTPEMRDAGGEVVGNLIEGIEMTERELMTAFERNGVQKISPQQGEKFDPNFHQAIVEIPGTGLPGGAVVDMTQTGYLLEDRLLRPAMVTVAKAEAGAAKGSNLGGSEEPLDPGSKVNTTA